MNEHKPCPQDASSLGEEKIKSPIVLSKCKNSPQEAVREERKGTRTRWDGCLEKMTLQTQSRTNGGLRVREEKEDGVWSISQVRQVGELFFP